MEKWRRYRHPKIYVSRENKSANIARWDWRPSKRLISIFSGVLVAVGVLWFLLGSQFFAIRSVFLQGEIIPEYNSVANSLIGQNIMLVSEARLLSDFKKVDPSLGSVRLTRGFPHELQISLERRHPTLVWQIGETKWAIDPSGVAFELDPTTLEGVPVVRDSRSLTPTAGEKFISSELVEFIVAAFSDSALLVNGRIDHAEVGETIFHLRVVTEWGWSIALDTTRPLVGQTRNLELVLNDYRDSIREYVDLRLAGWAYIK